MASRRPRALTRSTTTLPPTTTSSPSLLPNLYNDLPDFLHTIDVTYTPPPGGMPLEAFRLVKAKPVVVIKDNIVTPPEVDSDGKLYVITLPDVANPTAGSARRCRSGSRPIIDATNVGHHLHSWAPATSL